MPQDNTQPIHEELQTDPAVVAERWPDLHDDTDTPPIPVKRPDVNDDAIWEKQ